MFTELHAVGKLLYFCLKNLATSAKYVEFTTSFNFVLKYSPTYFVSQSVTGHLTAMSSLSQFALFFILSNLGYLDKL